MWRTATSSKTSRKDAVDEPEEAVSAPSAASTPLSPRKSAAAAAAQDDDEDIHLESASVYSETGLRVVQPRNDDSVISLFSNEDIGASITADDDSDSLSHASHTSSDDSSDLTALASRPRDGAAESAADTFRHTQSDPANSGSLSSLDNSFDDMVTPGLHTAGMASLHFGATFNSNDGLNTSNAPYRSSASSSRPSSSNYRSSAPHSPGAPPMTLASYLSSTLSSPQTRSMSSGSLASFPTDFLSDISRAESVADTDDGASELASDGGGDPSSSTSQLPPRSEARRSRRDEHLRDSSDLVMPKLAPSSNPDSHDGSSPSDSDKASPAPLNARRPVRVKQAQTTNNAANLTTTSSSFPRVLIAGGTSKSCRIACCHVILTVLNLVLLLFALTDKQQAKLKAALAHGSDTPVYENGQATLTNRNQHQESVESVESLAAAGERAERPFTVLQTILRPELPTSDAALLENLLPSLLEQVAAVSVCLLILDVQHGKSLAQHVLEQFQHIYDLSKFTALVPILVEADGPTERDSVSQLIQGSIDWLGRSKDGRLASLKAKARPYHIRDLDGIASALAGYDFNTSTVKSFQRWNSPILAFPARSFRGRQSPRQSKSMTPVSRPASNSSLSDVVNTATQGRSEDLPSFASSMLESVTLPPSVAQSESSTSSTGFKLASSTPRTVRRRQPCYRNNLDPLHLPSLLRLVGLNLATSFSSFACTVKAVFQNAKTTEEDVIRQLLEEDQGKNVNSDPKLEQMMPSVRPFYGCCRWRYSPEGEEYYQEEKCKWQRCGGIIFAGTLIGITLWFS